MSIDRKCRIAGLGVSLALLLGGCSGDKPAATPTAQPPVATPTAAPSSAAPVSTGTPSASLTPEVRLSPLGGKPASEAEKEYYNKKKEAEDLALAKNYEKALPIFEELHTQTPDDVEVMFYLMLCYGSMEEAPSKTSKAFGYAEKVIAAGPDSREAGKARSYINTANLVIPEKFKYGDETMWNKGNWVMDDPNQAYKASADIPFHTAMTARLSPLDQTTLWETEASPATATTAEKLPKGTEVKVLTSRDFIHGLTSWRKALPATPPVYDKTMFDMTAMYVEVTSEGPLKGKKGWIVNQADRYQGTATQEWGAWITNRLKIPREVDIDPTKIITH